MSATPQKGNELERPMGQTIEKIHLSSPDSNDDDTGDDSHDEDIYESSDETREPGGIFRFSPPSPPKQDITVSVMEVPSESPLEIRCILASLELNPTIRRASMTRNEILPPSLLSYEYEILHCTGSENDNQLVDIPPGLWGSPSWEVDVHSGSPKTTIFRKDAIFDVRQMASFVGTVAQELVFPLDADSPQGRPLPDSTIRLAFHLILTANLPRTIIFLALIYLQDRMAALKRSTAPENHHVLRQLLTISFCLAEHFYRDVNMKSKYWALAAGLSPSHFQALKRDWLKEVCWRLIPNADSKCRLKMLEEEWGVFYNRP